MPKDLSGRTHVCMNCGLAMERDLNAAKNILWHGQRPRGSRGDGCGDEPRTGGAVAPAGCQTARCLAVSADPCATDLKAVENAVGPCCGAVASPGGACYNFRW